MNFQELRIRDFEDRQEQIRSRAMGWGFVFLLAGMAGLAFYAVLQGI